MRPWWLVILAGVLVVAKAAQTPPPNLHLQTNIVQVPVTVTDSLNRIFTGLDGSEFHVFEDKVEQKISVERKPVPRSVGIILDTSGSMGGKLDSAERAVAGILQTMGGEDADEAFLIEFSDHPTLVQGFTHDVTAVQQRLTETKSEGKTTLFDAIYLGLEEMRKAKNSRRALIVISDGENNGSRYSAAEIANLERESDVQVFAIAMPANSTGRPAREDTYVAEALRQLTEPTGGMSFEVANDARDAAAKIGIALLSEYEVSYHSTNPAQDGKYRRVTVRLNPPHGVPSLHAYWKTGYYAPGH
jgi:Ca-activated chloride channel family protein